MNTLHVFPAWGRILSGRKPFLSLEITKECPLRCPGCYAYSPEHVAAGTELRQLSDFRGEQLVEKTLELVRSLRPLHVSIVGGEPLVRYREIDEILRALAEMNVEVQVVTSAVRRIPKHWADFPHLHLVVSIDGLQPEHDRRRAPATYDRILNHIAGHHVIVHCTITRQLVRPGYLQAFLEHWSAREEVRKVWFSLYTPQHGDTSDERLTPRDRETVCAELPILRARFPKLYLPDVVLAGFKDPPQSPEHCVFAQTTACVSADLGTRISPCQFGGKPVCAECGCIASAGMAAVARYRIAGIVPVSRIFRASRAIGRRVARERAA